jgi:hypothetical protein
VYLLLYVDDILITSQDLTRVEEVKALLASKFAVKDLGEARHFLGMQITFVRGSDGTLQSVKLSNENVVAKEERERRDTSQIRAFSGICYKPVSTGTSFVAKTRATFQNLHFRTRQLPAQNPTHFRTWQLPAVTTSPSPTWERPRSHQISHHEQDSVR